MIARATPQHIEGAARSMRDFVRQDVGHVPFVEIPDRFAADVTRFLDGCVEPV